MIKNAFAYVTRKSLKSLIIILVILSMSTLSLISLSIKDATDRASKETFANITNSFSMEINRQVNPGTPRGGGNVKGEDIIDKKDNKLDKWTAEHYYMFGLLAAEFAYLGLKKHKIPKDIASQVLNLNTKSQAIYTALDDDWQHFIKLRADNISGKVHPNMKIIADKIKELFNNK